MKSYEGWAREPDLISPKPFLPYDELAPGNVELERLQSSAWEDIDKKEQPEQQEEVTRLEPRVFVSNVEEEIVEATPQTVAQSEVRLQT